MSADVTPADLTARSAPASGRPAPERAAAPTAAQGSAPPVADPAGVLQPPSGAPAQTSPPPAVHGAAGTPGPETARPDPAAVRARVKAPAGAETPQEGTAPAGSRGLRGTEWQAAVKRAQRRQPGRAAPRAAAKVTIPPAPATGARLTASAVCMGDCDWTAGPGDPAEVDKAAERHTTRPPKHPTNTVSVVAS